VLAYGCRPSNESYYPLQERLRWDYVLSGSEHSTKDRPGRSIHGQPTSFINLPRRQLAGHDVIPQMTDFGGHQSFLFVAADDKGVYTVARQAEEDSEPEILETRSYVLHYPLLAGIAWERSVDTSTLRGHQVTIAGRSTIESAGDTVTVPAGTYRNCVKITTVASAMTRVPEFFGTVKIEVEASEWLAPGVGIVKAVQVERSDPAEVGGGTLTVVLAKFASF
jgi:hypothetical protein